jgi:hypothetical protein
MCSEFMNVNFVQKSRVYGVKLERLVVVFKNKRVQIPRNVTGLCIQEEIKSRLNSGNACYHSVQSLLSSRLLSRNVRVKV